MKKSQDVMIKKAFKVSGTLFFAFSTLFFLTTMLSIFTNLSDLVCAILSLPAAFIVGRSVWKSFHAEKIGPAISIASGALMLGALGLSIGFLGPMLFFPDANQGPMLGIFLTGPLGFLGGGIGGFIYWLKQAKSDRH